MITFAFNSAGVCMYSLNKEVAAEDLPDATYVVHMPEGTDVNSVWYDTSTHRVFTRTYLQPVISANRISGLPSGTKAALGAEMIDVTDNEIEFEVDYPQTLRVILFHPSYLDTVVEVPCEAQG